RRWSGTVTVGRKIIELIRGSISYRLQRIQQSSRTFLLERFREQGYASSLILGISRNGTDNYLDPTEGTSVDLTQLFTGGPFLGGDQQFMESIVDAQWFIPLDFSETYRTYFRLHGNFRHIYP